MQDNNIFGSSQAPTATPGPAPMPNPAPAPDPYQPNPYQPTPAGAAPINPMGNTPKKSHTGLIIGIVAGVVIIATILIVVFAVILPNANKSKDGDKKDSNSSKTEDKNNPNSGDNNGNNGNNGDSNKTLDANAPSIVFDGVSFKVGTTFGEVVRALNKLGYLYVEDGDFNVRKLTDLEAYLGSVYDFDKHDAGALPKIYFSTKEDEARRAYIYVSGWYSSFGNKTNKQVKFSDLNAYISINCYDDETVTLNGTDLHCDKTTLDDLKTAFPKGKPDEYGDYELEIGRYTYDFDFYEDKFQGLLIDVMPE